MAKEILPFKRMMQWSDALNYWSDFLPLLTNERMLVLSFSIKTPTRPANDIFAEVSGHDVEMEVIPLSKDGDPILTGAPEQTQEDKKLAVEGWACEMRKLDAELYPAPIVVEGELWGLSIPCTVVIQCPKF